MKYIALLRGVNVGGRTIKMTALKQCFEKLGFLNVVPVIQSGNVLFDSSKQVSSLKTTIEHQLSKTFNFSVKTQVYSLSDLVQVVQNCPYSTNDQTNHVYVLFFENDLGPQLIKEAVDLNSRIETTKLGKEVIYWRVPKGLTLKSNFAKYLTKAKYRDFHTNRNINTLEKIIALAA